MRLLLFAFSLLFAVAAQAQLIPQPPGLSAHAWLLLDYDTNRVLASDNPNLRIQPASLTKLMTLYLVFTALKQGSLHMNEQVPVSVKAWKTGGSRMFIEPGHAVTVMQLLHGVIVDSGNDACMALAQAVAGSTGAFVTMMNNEAQRLGMKHTHFMNPTGLPNPDHYSTARDLATLTAAIIRDFPEYYHFFSVKTFTYDNITQPNRNRLLWLDSHVDGLKTGHTEEAGYCLIASAKRGPRRLISVVLGTESNRARTQESESLLNFGFQAYDAVKLYAANSPVSLLQVYKGKASTVKAGFRKALVVSVPKGLEKQLKVQLVSRQPLLAPIARYSRVGTLKLSLGDKSWGQYPVVALQAVPVAGFLGRAWDSLRLWLK